jgi:hypothetical protein
MHKIRDEMRRKAYRINIFQVPRFKVWLNFKQKIYAIGIGRESPGLNFQSFKLYVVEQLQSNIDAIKVGTVRVCRLEKYVEDFYVS